MIFLPFLAPNFQGSFFQSRMFSQHSFRLRSFLSVTSPSHSTMDRHERPVKRLRRDSFHIEHRGELNGRLIHPLIYYDTYRFKQIRKLTSSRGRQRTSQSHRSMNVPIQTGLGAHASSSYARTSLAKSLVNRHTIKNTRPTFTRGDSSKQKNADREGALSRSVFFYADDLGWRP